MYGAASLREVLPRVDGSARFSFGGSNQLALQVREGAPADVFASASPIHTRRLFRAGLIERPSVFAVNELVLVVPAANPAGLRSVSQLLRPGIRLVVAAPTVPAGAYTAEALRRLGLAGVLPRAVSREPDVTGVVGKVALGEADAGFVYRTDALAAGPSVRAIPLPARAQPDVRYEIAVVTASSNRARARRFVARVLGPAGRGVLSGAGFGLPPRP